MNKKLLSIAMLCFVSLTQLNAQDNEPEFAKISVVNGQVEIMFNVDNIQSKEDYEKVYNLINDAFLPTKLLFHDYPLESITYIGKKKITPEDLNKILNPHGFSITSEYIKK